jgi:lipopolysaccharide/colanic/teichoic acid biosynthesis glycosyltransferase
MMLLKRLFDFLSVTIGLIFLSPLFLLIALAIKWDSKGEVFFKQIRVGQYGKLFHVLKFRTMVTDAEKKGAKITTGGDPRITSIGTFLRKYKLDELPQLINVLKGEMSLVGPRPEVPEYVEFYPENLKQIIFTVPPGITDRASIEYRDENEILVNSDDPVRDYREKVLPVKLEYYKQYVQERSFWLDFGLILSTLGIIIK